MLLRKINAGELLSQMNIKNIMLDLETMGKGSNAAIIAIGAVRFDDDGIVSNFYEVVDLQSSVDCGMTIDASTVMWWLKQSDSARSAITDANNVLSLTVALRRFSAWMGDDAVVWGNGSDFDNVILSNAYKCCDLKQPWKYHNNRCYRTLKNLYPDITLDRQGVHHHALDDASYQALHLIKILKAYKRPTIPQPVPSRDCKKKMPGWWWC